MTKSRKASSRAKRNTGGRKIKGRGDYKTFNLRGMAQKLDQALSSIPKGTFAKKGAQLGAKYGPLGALAGKGLGAGLAAVTGYGNYSVKYNTLARVSTSVDMVPQFVKNDHSIRVCHREFIRDVAVPATPSDFNLQAQLINPANKELFPWLAAMAKQYSQYKIHGMVFAYKTMSSDITAGGALGTIIMATNYNAIDRAFVSKLEMENSEFAVSTKPSMSMIHAIECDPKYSGLDVLYVRDPGYETTDQNDKRFYDYGKFQFASTGLPGTVGAVMGELWVSYDIEFMKPIIGGLQTSGTTVLSNTDGSLGLSLNSKPRTIIYTAPTLATLTAAQSYTPNPPLVGTVATGDTGLATTVVRPVNDSTFWLLRNGRYKISFVGTATNTLATPSNWASNGTSPVSLNTTTSGAAVVVVTPESPGDFFPLSTCNGITTRGISYNYVYFVTVNGIVNSAADYVAFNHSGFNAGAPTLATVYNRALRVEWLSLGNNSQDAGYVVNAA